MRHVQRISGFLCRYVVLACIWSRLASAGAPAPPPAAPGPHTPEHQLAHLGDFRFENGEVVSEFKVSYVTHGTLHENKENVILVMPAFTQDHHALDVFIGPGKALDTNKYFIVVTDMLGNSVVRQDVTTGPTNSGLKMAFPRYTLRDSVKLEYQFLKEYLGFDRILAAIGGSMGAWKAYQLAISYPAFVRGIIPIAGAPMVHPLRRAELRSMMDIIALDSGWYGGRYDTNPVTGVTTALLNHATRLYTTGWYATNVRTPEQLRHWEKRMRDIWTVFFPQDARDVYYQMQSVVDFTVGDTPGFNGDARAALQSIKAQVLLIAAKEDVFFTPEEIRFVKEAMPKAALVEIDSPFGHLICCGVDPDANAIMDREIAQFLAQVAVGVQ